MRELGIAVLLGLNGCASNPIVTVARNDSLNVPINLGNPADSGDAIHQMWVSFAAPDFVVLETTSAVLGPRRVEIGESWTADGRFAISSSAPLGCTALAYSISTSSEDVTDPNYNDEPPEIIRLFVTPKKRSLWQRLGSFPKTVACSLRRSRPNTTWSWSIPPPAERIPPVTSAKRNLPLTSDPMPLVGLPRGNFGFSLGATLSEAEENAKTRGLWPVSGTNVSAKPDEWRYFEVLRDPDIGAITMFLRDGTVSQLNISYRADVLKPNFEDVRQMLRKTLGHEVGFDDRRFDQPIFMGDGKTPSGSIDHLHNQSAFWSDCRTVIALQGRTRPDVRELSIQYHDLRPGSSMRFTTIGGGKSNSFSACSNTMRRP